MYCRMQIKQLSDLLHQCYSLQLNIDNITQFVIKYTPQTKTYLDICNLGKHKMQIQSRKVMKSEVSLL